MKILKVPVLLSVLLSGCTSVFRDVTITDIDISPRTLPPDGGKVKIVVKTYNADYVRVYFKREGDGKTFVKDLSTEFWLGIAYGEQKWDGEITLPPNNDPEQKDHVYKVTVEAWNSNYYSDVKDGGKVIVNFKPESGSG